MNIDPVGLAAMIIGAGALATALCTLQALRQWRLRCTSVEASIEALRREFELVASISARTGRRVQRVAHEYSGVVDRVDLVESRGVPVPIDQAIEWARSGANSEKLAEKFGLSSGEAELVARLHGGRQIA
jgi:hypothetical protein